MKKELSGSDLAVTVPLAVIKMIQEKLDSVIIYPWEKKELNSCIDFLLSAKQRSTYHNVQYIENFDLLIEKRRKQDISSCREEFKKFSNDQFFLEGTRFEIAYKFLELVEQDVGEYLWLAQSGPFDYGFDYGLRVAQAEYGAPVLSKYLPQELYFSHLNNLCKNRLVIAELPEEANEDSFVFFLQVLETAADSNYQNVLINLDEGFQAPDEHALQRLCKGLSNLIRSGKKIHLGMDRFTAGSPQDKLSAALKGVLQ